MVGRRRPPRSAVSSRRARRPAAEAKQFQRALFPAGAQRDRSRAEGEGIQQQESGARGTQPTIPSLPPPPGVGRGPPLLSARAPQAWLRSVAAELEPGRGRSNQGKAHGGGCISRAHAHVGVGRRLPCHCLRLPRRRALPPSPWQGPLRSLL